MKRSAGEVQIDLYRNPRPCGWCMYWCVSFHNCLPCPLSAPTRILCPVCKTEVQ